MTPELEKRALARLRHFSSSGTDSTPTPSRPSSPSPHSTPDLSSARPLKTPSNGANGVDIMRWHANLEARLRPFWSGVLSNRTLRFSVRPYFEAGPMFPSPSELALLEEPLAENSTITDANGAFKIRLIVPWNTLQPRGAPISSVNTDYEHAWAVTAELMPLPPSRPPTPYESYPSGTPSPLTFTPTAITTERVTLTHSPIRVISDIDDTVKLSGVTRGARAVFHNVFVKDLAENVIPGMGEWYSEMWRRGVRFHYVVSLVISSTVSVRRLKMYHSQTVPSSFFLSSTTSFSSRSYLLARFACGRTEHVHCSAACYLRLRNGSVMASLKSSSRFLVRALFLSGIQVNRTLNCMLTLHKSSRGRLVASLSVT
jgi:ribosomal protein L30/L7E